MSIDHATGQVQPCVLLWFSTFKIQHGPYCKSDYECDCGSDRGSNSNSASVCQCFRKFVSCCVTLIYPDPNTTVLLCVWLAWRWMRTSNVRLLSKVMTVAAPATSSANENALATVDHLLPHVRLCNIEYLGGNTAARLSVKWLT